jgi:hypothetical protein
MEADQKRRFDYLMENGEILSPQGDQIRKIGEKNKMRRTSRFLD